MNNTGSQRGQTLVLITLFMFALLGMCALAIDVGSWYQQKRSLQSGSRRRRAGGRRLPAGRAGRRPPRRPPASSARTSTGGSLSYQPSTTFVTNDSIIVTATKPSPSFFAQVFGHSSVTIKATAKATVVQTRRRRACRGA